MFLGGACTRAELLPDCQCGSSPTTGSLSVGGGRISLAGGMYVLACVSRWVGLQERVTMKFSCSEYGGGRYV